MFNAESITRLSAMTLAVMTTLMLGYHVAHFLLKHGSQTSADSSVLERPHTGPEVVVLAPMPAPTSSE
ncbi:MAG: hypothetical protein QM706_01230 [Nitrospira sp.]